MVILVFVKTPCMFITDSYSIILPVATDVLIQYKIGRKSSETNIVLTITNRSIMVVISADRPIDVDV